MIEIEEQERNKSFPSLSNNLNKIHLMKKNNFDTCSYMPAIELYAERDSDLAQRDFDENFEMISNELYLFTDYSQIGFDSLGIADLLDFTEVGKEEAREYLKEFDENFEEENEDYSDQNISLRLSDYLENEANTNDIVKKNCDFEFPKSAKYNFERIIVRGSCQGDYAEIIMMKSTYDDFFVNIWETEKHIMMKDFLSNLFFNQPVYFKIQVGSHEYNLHEEMKDAYDYDKQEMMELLANFCAKDFSGEDVSKILDWAKNNFPKDL